MCCHFGQQLHSLCGDPCVGEKWEKAPGIWICIYTLVAKLGFYQRDESAFSSESTEHLEVLLPCTLRTCSWVWFYSEKAELSSLFSISRIFPNGDAKIEFSLETHEPRKDPCCWKKHRLFLRAQANKGWPLWGFRLWDSFSCPEKPSWNGAGLGSTKSPILWMFSHRPAFISFGSFLGCLVSKHDSTDNQPQVTLEAFFKCTFLLPSPLTPSELK